MTQRELIYIKTVAEEKSISLAARKLFIAQPSLSQYIRRIEDNLGAALFHRSTSGLTLTYAGEKYYHMALQILKMYENFEMEISDMNELKTGRIHIGITSHLGTVVLPGILPGFMKKYPAVDVTVTEDTSERLETLLAEGKVDFIIVHAPEESNNPLLEYEFLSRDCFLVVAGKNSPLGQLAEAPAKAEKDALPILDIRHLSKERFIMLPSSQRIRQISDAILNRAGISQPGICLTVKNYATAQFLAVGGAGVTFIPRQYTRLTSMDTEGSFFAIPPQYKAYWNLSVGTSRNSFLSKADLVFIEAVKEAFHDPLSFQ